MDIGRPKKPLDRTQLTYLRSLRFTWDEIASLLGVSSRTIQRRASMWSVKTYSSVSDTELDRFMSSFVSQFPRSGEVMICGHLRSLKVRIFWSCVVSWASDRSVRHIQLYNTCTTPAHAQS